MTYKPTGLGHIAIYVMYEINMNMSMACHYNKRIEPEPELYNY